MKPKISTGYLTPQNKKTKNIARGRLSDTEENASETGIDENIFAALMKCPEKKKMILQLLASNKDAIEKYKKKEINSSAASASPLRKLKNKKPTCESPTALLRRRALQQMNTSPSTNKCSETSSDQSASPVPFDKILKGVVAYVEIKNKDQDRSSGAKAILKSMGAKLREKFSNDVTHVIFKDGSFMTYQKAKLMKIHLVSILWVEFCRKTMIRQPEKQYPALNNGFHDNETSMICSQMQKEYEDIIRDEYRRSIMNGTPLPSTRSLINRRRTLMTPSVSNLNSSSTSFETAAESISSQELTDREVAAINGFQNSETIDEENLVLNDPDCFSDVSGPMVNGNTVEKRNSISSCILQTCENLESSDMELTAVLTSKLSKKQKSKNDSNMELTVMLDSNKTPKKKVSANDIYNEKTPKLPAKEVATALFDRRKTICNSLLSFDTSITSHISSDKSNNVSSWISSDRSRTISDTASFAVPKSVKKSKRSSESLFGSNESFLFGKNKAKSSKICCSGVDKSASAMSELNLSSDKNPSAMSDLYVSSEKKESEKSKSSTRRSRSISKLCLSSEKNTNENLERSSSMSDLHLSSENSNKNKEKSLEVSLDINDKIVEKSCMSSLHVSSVDNRKPTDKSSMSSLQVSTESGKSLGKKDKSLNSNPSVMSSLRVSSEKVPGDFAKQTKEKRSNDTSFSSVRSEGSSGVIKNLIEDAIQALQTPESHKKSDQSSNSLSSRASVNSDDSEIVSPKKNVRRSMIRQSIRKDDNLEDSSCDLSKDRELELLSSITKRRRRTLGSRGITKTATKTVQNDSPIKDLVVNVLKSPINNLPHDKGNAEKPAFPNKTSGRKGIKKTDLSKTPGKDLVVNILKSPLDKLQSTEDSSKNSEPATLKLRRRTLGQKGLKEKDADLPKIPGKDCSYHKDQEFVENSTKSPSNVNLYRKRAQVELKNKNKNKNHKSNSNTSANTSDMEMDHSLNRKTTSDDSSDSTKSRTKSRKLYNPDDSIHVLIDDEEERKLKRVEVRKRRSDEGVFINPTELLISADKRIQNASPKSCIESESDDDGPTPPKRIRKGKKKELKRVSLNSSADEQKELLNEVINKKHKPKVAPKTPKSRTKNNPKGKGKTPEVKIPVETPSRRKSMRIIKPTQKLIDSQQNGRNIPFTPINRRSTLDFQPVSASKKPKKVDKIKLPTIVCTKLHKSDVQVFAQIVKKLGRFTVEDEVSSRTTHLVAGEPKRTINMLRAVSRGCWVVKFEWVLQSLEAGKWLREEDFEVHDFSPAVQKSRLERQAFGATYSLDVFESSPPIYVALNTNPRCSDLKELITVCKGKIVTSPRMAKIIVGEYLDQEDTACVNETWVLDCITFNKKMAFKRQYLLEKNKDNKRKSLVV